MTNRITQEASEQTPRSTIASVARELLVVLVMVVLGDLLIYRCHGFLGPALFLPLAGVLLYFGKPRRQITGVFWLLASMLVLVGLRLAWYGSALSTVVGFAWLFALATVLNGQTPYVVAVLAMASQTIAAGGRALWDYTQRIRSYGGLDSRRGLSVLLPLIALLVFGTLFILANPHIVTFVSARIRAVLESLSDWFVRLALQPTEILFWVAMAWVTAGLLQPLVSVLNSAKTASTDRQPTGGPIDSPLFRAYRNTLLTVIGLFAIYLAYEFYSLWTRDFPPGFYYAGYAHQGAAWLTTALALATLTLSMVFSGRILHDPRIGKLRVLAWIWSVQNLLLSAAVYNRLLIYIDYNGMTRMRIVGLFGITVVVVGFLLVVVKIVYQQSFIWLIQRQAWALASTVYLFAVIPVDGLAVKYNVDRIRQGELSACMQIGVQKLDLEGVLSLPPLLECSTPEIREGAAALMAQAHRQLQQSYSGQSNMRWTALQLSERYALKRLGALREQWARYENDAQRAATIKRFYDFAYKWY